MLVPSGRQNALPHRFSEVLGFKPRRQHRRAALSPPVEAHQWEENHVNTAFLFPAESQFQLSCPDTTPSKAKLQSMLPVGWGSSQWFYVGVGLNFCMAEATLLSPSVCDSESCLSMLSGYPASYKWETPAAFLGPALRLSCWFRIVAIGLNLPN